VINLRQKCAPYKNRPQHSWLLQTVCREPFGATPRPPATLLQRIEQEILQLVPNSTLFTHLFEPLDGQRS
jgi:hypothetical protein